MSKKQYQAVLKWLLKHYIYLGILAFGIAFAMLPMHGMMKAGTIREIMSHWDMGDPSWKGAVYAYTKDLSRGFLFYPVNLEITCLIFGGIGFGSALVLFGHLFSRKQSMMYAGLALTKGRDFLLRTEAFLILAWAPVLLCSLSYPVLVHATGMGMYFDTGLYLKEALAINLTVLYGYAVGALSAQIFGNLWAAILGGAVIGGSVEAVYGSWYSITCWYLHTMRPGKPVHLMADWSPMVSLYKGLYQADRFHWFPAVTGILFLALLAWRASLRNRPERAGQTINLEWIQKPGRAWIAILGGSAGGWMLARMMGPEYSLYVGIGLGTLFAALGARMLAEQNIRVSLKGWGLPAVCMAVLLLCGLGLRMDLTGYDSYLPDEDQIVSVAFGQAYYEETREPEMSRFAEPENLEAAQKWITLLRDQSAAERKEHPFQKYPDIALRVQWATKDGKTVTRQYPALEDKAAGLDMIRTLANSEEYRNQTADGIPEYQSREGSSYIAFNLNLQEDEFRDLFGFSPRLNWERIKTQQLRETLAADIRERTWDDMQGQVLARCWFYENDEETGTYRNSDTYTIYDCDERTTRLVWGDQAERVLAFIRGGWADSTDVMVFRCEFDPEAEGMGLTDYAPAASPDQAREWVARTTQCQSDMFRAPTEKGTVIRIYCKPGIRRWAENEGMEELLEDPAFWEHLPEQEDLYNYLTLQVRAD